ncbi:carbohydrate kinase [Cereibacter sphaeroides]|uniref:Fructokinase n=1 Tax=Cereibacter sphaeroides (strain ATCC 17023 / DSM 158 / JCM 6121 / CCUG 31486 / LMG 2827 / NBRC 12203 / NCIMB 8253 / ATH 2.4.1.) TaxID=272943 RepID=Q3J473_CERS4|nr:carbohydrate kinase [Cereibacter sphaeroides]ABA78411.1 putative Fructokinase [Cereibacter sphaeroides 2.4.1]AMJ46761.1 carbohydrate kinase [Cereibacter sphaeroides]ANS33474.1 carbohydrate kinase [Cereibacter sphaeroides]ATN62517.1 carbohydrate kinase [Cereibacter sphaeroides]AXC60627.1 carbohydrate kinase [Cereibacter sphaeroides 2.4.1]
MILCCGEALIDMLPRETTAGEAAFAPYAGGAVFNTAIALGRLGAPAGFFSGLSTDLFGVQLAETLAASQVETDLCARSDRPTTLAFVRLTNGQASYAFYDENTAGRLLAPADLPALPDRVSTLFFGGISLVNEPAAATYEALMAREAPRRVTMLDPNIRPGFIADAAAYRARIGRMIALADILKLSDEDLHWLEGPGQILSLARGLLARGPKLVLVTEGAVGARAVTATEDRFCAATPVQVADTVGAGDTFNAGVLAALHEAGALSRSAVASLSPETLAAALALGTRAAAVTVSRPGANPPWVDEL